MSVLAGLALCCWYYYTKTLPLARERGWKYNPHVSPGEEIKMG
jgi:hypothetical protein